MISKDGIITLVDYHYARHRQVWDSLMTLPEDQFLQNVSYSHGSLRDQWLHMMDDDAKWIGFLMGANVAQLATLDFPTRADIKAAYDRVEASSLAFVNNIDDDTLSRVYQWHVPVRPEPQYVKGWQILIHLVNHGTDHRAQVLRILHDFGAPTFDQDVLSYWLQTDQLTGTDIL